MISRAAPRYFAAEVPGTGVRVSVRFDAQEWRNGRVRGRRGAAVVSAGRPGQARRVWPATAWITFNPWAAPQASLSVAVSQAGIARGRAGVTARALALALEAAATAALAPLVLPHAAALLDMEGEAE